MKLYHTTTAAAAAAILRDGFSDATGSYGFVGKQFTGVFFSDEPVGINEGAKGDPVLEDPVLVVDIPEEEILEFGWVDAIREWCIPAALVNRYGPPKVLYHPLDDWAHWSDWWADQPLLTKLRG